jgi:hypothetical protein
VVKIALHSCGARELQTQSKEYSLHYFRSTHNTRIERVWVEVGRHFGRAWRGFVTRLKWLHNLDRGDTEHLWLLHVLFLNEIENDCDAFRATWNKHPISDKGKNMSPDVSSCTNSDVLASETLILTFRTSDFLARQKMALSNHQIISLRKSYMTTMGSLRLSP